MSKKSKISTGSLEKILYSISLEKLQAQQADEKFQEEKARKESTFLAKASRVLISLWDFTGIIMKSSPGTQVVFDADSGRIFRAKFSEDKLKKFKELPQRMPGRDSLLESVNLMPEYLLKRPAEFTGGISLSERWRRAHWKTAGRKAPKPTQSIVVALFEEKLKKATEKNITKKYFQNNRGYKYVEITIEGYPVSLGINLSTNKVRYYVFQGKRFDVKA